MEEFARQLIDNAPYIGMVIVLLLTGVGMPVPEDVPLLIGGYLCSQGDADIRIMIPIALVTVVGSDSGIFWMGRRWGHHITRFRWVRFVLSEAALSRAERAFHRHGGKTLFFMRFVPGVRAAAFFTAGTFKLPFWKLLVFDGLAALISVPMWIILGYYFGEEVRQFVVNTTGLALGLIVLLAGAYIAFHYWRKRKATPQHQIVKPEDRTAAAGTRSEAAAPDRTSE